MKESSLTENFNHIYDTLRKKNMSISAIAESMGYTTSAQLHNVIEGKSMLSTKAIIALVANVKINPNYLFLGEGDMFLGDKSEIEKLQEEYQFCVRGREEAYKVVMKLHEMIKILEKRNDDLINMSAAALKYYQGEMHISSSDLNTSENPIKAGMELLKTYGISIEDDDNKNGEDSKRSLKHNKQ